MTKFTKEYIYKVRVYSTLIDEPASEVIEECLDEIERLQARVQELEIYNKNFHLACINALDLHRESDVPKLKDIPKIIEELRTRVQELETYIDDCQSKPCYANKKEEARKKINDILAHALTERKEDYYLDGKYFRWGKLEKDIMEVVDNIFVDGGNENAK